MAKADLETDNITLVNKGKTPLMMKENGKSVSSSDDEFSDDQDLLNRVDAKLKSLKSEYKDSLKDDDEFSDADKTPLTKDEFVGERLYGTERGFSKSSLSLSNQEGVYDDDMQEINLDGLSKEDVSKKDSYSEISKSEISKSETLSLAPKKSSGIGSWFSRRKSSTLVVSKQSKNDFAFLNEQGEIISFKLMVTRAEENTELFKGLTAKEQEQIKTSAGTLKGLFNEFRKNMEKTDQQPTEYIDCDFWSQVVNDYHAVVVNEPIRLYQELTNGIPTKLKGLVWQLVLDSKSFSMEDLYSSKVTVTSPHEKQIKKDLARTRFVSEASMADKSESLYNIIKAYSLYDTEVGYTQGMAFVAVPLLMNMNESEAFCALAKLMKSYNLRDLYLPEMPGLHLILYQFERLLEDLCPKLYLHIMRQGIRSSMYASQWFLTMFAYKFPLAIVIRIFDVIVAEGREASLKFALALMMKNQDKLLTCNFDQLLEFLKDKLFDYYLVNDQGIADLNPFSFMSSTESLYRVDELVQDAMKIKIVPLTLKKYATEFQEIHKLEKEREEEMETLRTKNAQLTREIRKLEQSYAVLNKEHVEVANEMIQGKVNLANLEDENSDLKQEVLQLEEKIKELELEQEAQLKEIEQNPQAAEELPIEDIKQSKVDIEEEIRRTMERNLEVMEANRFLEEQLNTLERQYKDSRKELDAVKQEHEELKKKWNIAKNLFAS